MQASHDVLTGPRSRHEDFPPARGLRGVQWAVLATSGGHRPRPQHMRVTAGVREECGPEPSQGASGRGTPALSEGGGPRVLVRVLVRVRVPVRLCARVSACACALL